MIAFPLPAGARATTRRRLAAALQEDGFVRVIVGGRLVNLAEEPLPDIGRANGRVPSPLGYRPCSCTWWSIGWRPAAPPTSGSAIRWKRRSPRAEGGAMCSVDGRPRRQPQRAALAPRPSLCPVTIDGRPWRRMGFSTQLACEDCGIEYPAARAAAVQFQQPAGGVSRSAKVSATSSASTWTWSFPIRTSRSARGHRPVEHARPTPTSWRSCWRWPATTTCRWTCRSAQLDRAAAGADRRTGCRSGSSAGWRASSPGWSGGSTRCTSACS